MIKGVIFDLDGTLIKLPINYNKIFEKLNDLFKTNDEFKPLIPTILKKSYHNPNLQNMGFEIICREEIKAVENLEIFDGTIEILKYINKKNIKIFLVTMQCKSAAEAVLKNLKIKKYFSEIITRDEIPDRYLQIMKIIKNNEIAPKEMLLIGDRMHDINSAKKAQCIGILISKKTIDKPDFKIISNLLELKNIIS